MTPLRIPEGAGTVRDAPAQPVSVAGDGVVHGVARPLQPTGDRGGQPPTERLEQQGNSRGPSVRPVAIRHDPPARGPDGRSDGLEQGGRVRILEREEGEPSAAVDPRDRPGREAAEPSLVVVQDDGADDPGRSGGRGIAHGSSQGISLGLRMDSGTLETLFARRTRAAAGDALAEILALGNATDIISFAGGFPDPSIFPGAEVAEIVRELIETGDTTAMQYPPVDGLPTTRAFLADRIERLEGVRPDESELFVTSGGIEALELLGKVFLDPGDVVLVEGPTYLGAIMGFASFEADVRAVPMDDEGLDVEQLADLLARGLRPKLLYSIPDHQNPSGVSMSGDRRRSLAELARRYGFVVVEDVAYREITFDGRREPCLWSLAPDVVVQVGTFAKLFCPGVRLGWAVGPPPIVAKLAWAKQNTDQGAAALGQRIVTEYGRRGLLEPRIAASIALYRARCVRMLAELSERMPETASWTRPSGGFFLWVTLPPGSNAVTLAAAARQAGVAFVPGTAFFPDGRGVEHLRLSFSRAGEDVIPDGIARLARLIAPG